MVELLLAERLLVSAERTAYSMFGVRGNRSANSHSILRHRFEMRDLFLKHRNYMDNSSKKNPSLTLSKLDWEWCR